MKAVQVENAKSKSGPKNFIRFPWKVDMDYPNRVPPQFWKREKLIFREVRGRLK